MISFSLSYSLGSLSNLMTLFPVKTLFFRCAPGMGDNLVVKVHYGLGSRNR